jgi:hypothetical protein
MRLFGWVIEREKEQRERNTWWFARGLDVGWSNCVDKHEEVLKAHGVTVIKCSPELYDKLDLNKVAA